MNGLSTAISSAVALTFSSLGAFADEAVVYDRHLAGDDDVVVTEEPVRVYGWQTERPLDCGEFHYWNGEQCIDARNVAPDTGPKF